MVTCSCVFMVKRVDAQLNSRNTWNQISGCKLWVSQSALRNGIRRRVSFSQLSRCLRCWDQCYAQEHAEQIDDEVKAVLPVDAVDVLAHNQRVFHLLLSIRKALPTLKTIENRSALTLGRSRQHILQLESCWQTRTYLGL